MFEYNTMFAAHSKALIALGDGSKTSISLCFDKKEFMMTNFSVDEFLHKNRNAPSLEQLRDDLGIYLKDLRASMIDLINEDYADFVSLSANLVGLDLSIANITNPLIQFRNEAQNIRALIQECGILLRKNLERKQQLREQKRNLQCLQQANDTVKKLEILLEHQLKDQLKPIDLERAALELIQLQFNQQFCLELLTDDQKNNNEKLQKEVMAKLRTFFNEALKNATSTCSEQLERCLRIYITLDACETAEQVFREDIVAPYMNANISEHCLQNSPQGLAGIYSNILNFISLHMTDLLRLTQYTDKLIGFNFLVNSFWADVEMRLETYMASIFAPGNSDVFYAKYKCTRNFLSKIEELLASKVAVVNFRRHKQTVSFQSRWNLPVYFQICFQEIAGEFEAALEPLLTSDTMNATTAVGDGRFQLATFNYANKAIERCWAAGIYLSEVFPKFYKLNLQILLRLSRWISDVICLIVKINTSNPTNLSFPANLHKTDLLIALYGDIQMLIKHLPQMQLVIQKNTPKDNENLVNLHDVVAKSFVDVGETLTKHLCSIEEALVAILIADSGIENVCQVKDLPRLYRKTNREVPTKPSAYVEQMLRPLKLFEKEQSAKLEKNTVSAVLSRVCSKITTDYFAAVSDVLTSVQKTEESLRRLRNLKSAPVSLATGTATMSDDDKIRSQLHVDVIAWTGEVAKLNVMPSQVEKLLDLNKIVEESTKIKENNISGAQ